MNITHRDKKVGFQLTHRHKAILVGSLLGDANMHSKGNSHRVLFKHGENQMALIVWKRQEFDSITGMKVNYFQQLVKGKKYGFCQFVTLTHPEFSELYKSFYVRKRKIVPNKISELLRDPLSLAVWIMDDGARDNVGLTLQTHSFSMRGVERLRKSLRLNFNLKTNSRKNKGSYVIYFPKSEIQKLWNLVRGYILLEYKYKFPLTP